MNSISQNQSEQQIKIDAHQTEYLKFYAQPYNMDATGFYFTDLEDYESKSEALTDRFGNQVEEFEIQFIDGSNEESALFQAASVNQANLDEFLEMLDDHSDQLTELFFLMSNFNYSMADAIGKVDDVTIYQGNLKDAAEELFDECYLYEIPEHLRNYIDYDAFARDCQQDGDMTEFEFAGSTYTCTNANGI